MDYSQGRQSDNLQTNPTIAQDNIAHILRFLQNPNSQTFNDFRQLGRRPRNDGRVPIPYDPNNGIARGPDSDIQGVPAGISQLAQQDATRVVPIAGEAAPSVSDGMHNERMLQQLMPQTPAINPIPEIPPIDQLPPQNTPRLQQFQKLFQNINPNQLDILNNIRGTQ